jgi:hypothetical protein
MKPFHRSGSLLMLSGITPEDRDGVMLHPGRLGETLGVDEGYAAARKCAINALGMIRLAVGSLDYVKSPVRALNFLVATPGFDQHHRVGEGVSAVLSEVFGDAGRCGRADIGVMSLSRGNCCELWLTVELTDDAPRMVA